MPFELTDPCPRVGSAVADGAGIIIVLAWPVTVVTLVMASVAVLGDGAGVGEGLEFWVGEGDATSVLGCVCATTVLAQFRYKKNLWTRTLFQTRGRGQRNEIHTVVELVVADEAGTVTAEEVSAVDELAWTELCAYTTDINVVIEGPEVGVVSTAEVEEDEEQWNRRVLGVELTDAIDKEAWVLGDAPSMVPDGAMLRAT
jgi:hypothetical protein